MIVQVLGEVPPELHVTPEQDERLAEQARRVGQAEVVRLIELIAAALRAMKDGADARTQLELALVKAATPDLEPSVKALLARIDRLESNRAPAPCRPEDARARGDRRGPRGRRGTADRGRDHRPGRGPAAGRGLRDAPGRRRGRSSRSRRRRGRRGRRASSRRRPIPRPAVTAVATVEPDVPAGAPSLELSLESFGDRLARGAWTRCASARRCWPPLLDEASPGRARRDERADARLARVVRRSSSARPRTPQQPDLLAKAIRAVTGSSLRLAYELRAAAEIAPAVAVAGTFRRRSW